MPWAPRAGAQEKTPQVVGLCLQAQGERECGAKREPVESRNEAEEVRRSWSRKGLVTQGWERGFCPEPSEFLAVEAPGQNSALENSFWPSPEGLARGRCHGQLA